MYRSLPWSLLVIIPGGSGMRRPRRHVPYLEGVIAIIPGGSGMRRPRRHVPYLEGVIAIIPGG